MKNVSLARKQLATRTAFNLLGPLSNPANVKNQLVGVFSNEFLTRLPHILKRKGVENIMTVRSNDGMDEFSTSSTNSVCILKNNIITELEKLGISLRFSTFIAIFKLKQNKMQSSLLLVS